MGCRLRSHVGVLIWGVVLTPLQVVWSLDCNENSVDDLIEIEGGASEDCNENGVPDECERLPLAFGLKFEDVTVEESPVAIVAADLDADDTADLITVNSGADSISVILGRGDGTFGEPTHLPVGLRPQAIVTGDLDRDGHLDLVIANKFSDDVTVLFGSQDGAFTTISVGTGAQPVDLVMVDLDADGYQDVATANRTSVSLLFGQGDRTFRAPLELSVHTLPISVVTEDFNGDGHPDLATASTRDREVAILLNNGDGTFQNAVRVEVGSDPVGLMAGDFDGDGTIDFFTANQSSRDLFFFRGRVDGTFELAAKLPLAERPVRVRAVDLDADGIADFVVSNLTNKPASLLLSDGRGGFAAGAVDLPVAGGPAYFASSDFDGDGDADLAAANFSTARVSVFLNNELGSFPLGTATYAVGAMPHSGTLIDVDLDGDLDVATGNGGSGKVSILFNDGAGTFTEPVIYDPGGWLLSMDAGDLDSDGDPDLIALDHGGGSARVLLNDGKGVFLHPEELRFAVSGRSIFVVLLHIDDDGILDLVSSAVAEGSGVKLFSGNGDGSFRLIGELTTAGAVTVLHGDFDDDEDEDLALANPNGSTFSVLLNRGDFEFEPAASYPVFGSPVSGALGDYNGDRILDLAAVSSSREVSVLFGLGNGTFGVPERYTLERAPFHGTAADMDGDGDLDLVTANAISVSILVNDGGGTFSRSVSYGVGNEPRVILTGDLNGDGDVDVVTANRQSNSVSALVSRSPPAFSGAYLEVICTAQDFSGVSIRSRSGGAVERLTKFTAPVDRSDPTLISTAYQNVSRFQLHQEFLSAVFPAQFPALDGQEYDRLTGRRATRRYYTGALRRLRSESGPLYGFSVFVNPAPTELLSLEEVQALHATLSESFTLAPLGYVPDTPEAREAAEGWGNPSFPIYSLDVSGGGSGDDYEAYTVGVGFGGVRLLDAASFAAANSSGLISSRDILILERAPRDIEGVFAGVITAERQGELSHLLIRTARRGTPNAHVAEALEAFAPFSGQLVRVEVKPSTYEVRAATLEEAEEFWAANTPMLSELPEFDAEFAELSSLGEISALDAVGVLESRFGGKASNLGRLQGILTGSFQQYQEAGFAIPMRYFFEFLRTNNVVSRVSPPQLVSYQEYLQELFSEARFQSDSEYRFAELDRFRDFARANGEVAPALIDALVARIEATFPSLETMVRFRSSSNVEDALEFNGAGLYESTSACALDTLDTNNRNSSYCDSLRNSERTMERALKKVWTSLWTFRAFEERSFFGVEETSVSMGILVNRRFADERANGVAFTGNPANRRDRRYTVAVQVGEESVVSPAPGVLAEKNLLEIVDGDVVGIERATSSTLLPAGEYVLSEAQLVELGRLMAHIDANFPLDLGEFERSDVLLDMEFKIESSGDLAVKQVRPFLQITSTDPEPTFQLEIPSGTQACGVFDIFRDPRTEYDLKSTVEFVSGELSLPTGEDRFSGELFQRVLVGPEREEAQPLAVGEFEVTRLPPSGGERVYRFAFEQEYELMGGERFTLRLSSLEFKATEDGEPLESKLVGEEFLARDLVLRAGPLGESSEFIRYGSCSYPTLPLFGVRVDVEGLVSGRIELRERFEEPTEITLTGPAALVGAELELAGERRVVNDYWRLVYAASRHNTFVSYWVVLEEPLSVAAFGAPIHAVEVVAPETFLEPHVEASVNFLDESLEVLGSSREVSYSKRPLVLNPSFRRGDSDGNGVVQLGDAVLTLRYQFQRGEVPVCLKAADSNDDGKLNVVDAVTTLLHLFVGRASLPEPFGDCAEDPTEDTLSCLGYPCL